MCSLWRVVAAAVVMASVGAPVFAGVPEPHS